jgi:hypothetical protein
MGIVSRLRAWFRGFVECQHGPYQYRWAGDSRWRDTEPPAYALEERRCARCTARVMLRQGE